MWEVDLTKVTLTIAALALFGAVQLAEGQTRRLIQIIRYSGNPQTYESFKSILQNKLNLINNDDDLKRYIETEKLSILKVVDLEGKENPTIAILKAKWSQDDKAILIIYGLIPEVADASKRVVQSSIFVGPGDTMFATELISTDLSLDLSQFRTLRDTHSLLLFYSLAKDARARGAPDNVVSMYLSKAVSIANDLSAKNPQLLKEDEGLASLVSELSTLARSLKK